MDQPLTTQRLLETAARRIITFVVLIAPWLIGGAEPWAYLLIGSTVSIGGICWLLSLFCGNPRPIRAQVTATCLGALVLIVLLQMIPLPRALVELLSPFGANQITEASEAFKTISPPHDLIEHVDLSDVPYTLSVAPSATSRSLFLFITYVLCFMVMANTIHGWDQLKRIATLLVFNAAVMAVLGMIHKFSGSQEILWVHTPRYGGEIFGPFTNRNHFAAHMNLGLGLALGILFSSKQFSEMMNWPDWRDRLSWFSSRSASAMAIMSFNVVLLVGSVCVCQSRGGVLAMAVTMVAFGFYIGWRRRDLGRTRIAMIAATFLVAAAVLWLGRGQVISRLATLGDVARDPMKDLRVIITIDTLRVFLAFPIMGAGFGGYRHIFSAFQTPDLSSRWLHAHNDWAQLLAEGGIVSAVVFLAVCIAWALGIRKRYSQCASRSRLFITGISVGFATIFLHSFIDYSLHKPGNACLLAAMAGMAVAASHIRSRRIVLDDSDEDEKSIRPLSPTTIKIIAVTGVLGIVVLMNSMRSDLRAELAFTRFKHRGRMSASAAGEKQIAALAAQALREAEIVLIHGRGNPDALTELSRDLVQWTLNPALDRPFRVRQSLAASSGAALAAHASPTDYLTWLSLARTLMAIGYWDQSEESLQRARDIVRHANQVRMFESRAIPEGQAWEDARRKSPNERAAEK
jgi:O-antigen ligase